MNTAKAKEMETAREALRDAGPASAAVCEMDGDDDRGETDEVFEAEG